MCGGGSTQYTSPYGEVKYDDKGRVIEGSAQGQKGGLAIGQQMALDQLKEGMPDYYGGQTYADMDPATTAAHKQMLRAAGGAATQANIAEGRKNLFALRSEADRAGEWGLQAANRMIGAGGDAQAAGLRGEQRGYDLGLQGQAGAATAAGGIRGYGADAAAAGTAALGAVDPLSSATMGYGQGATQNLSQGAYAGLTPFQQTQMENLLAGKLDTDYLKPAVAGMASTVGEEFRRNIAPALRTGTINTGQGRGYSTREAVIAGLEGEKLAGALAGQAGQMYTGAVGQALGQRLPAAQLALQAQQQAQQLGLQGGDLRLRGGQLAQQGALGAGGLGAQAGQLGLAGTQLAQQGALSGAQLAQQGALGAGGLYGQAGAAAQQGLRTAQAGRQAALGATRDITTLPGDMAKYGLEVGARREAQEDKRIGADIEKYNYNAMAERQALENYMRTIQGSYGSATTKPGPSGLQSAGQIASILAALGGSDVRIKENIEPAGTWKGFNVYTFNYIPSYGDPVPRRRGVMAQEVERTRPDAVVEIDGIKHVAYGWL